MSDRRVGEILAEVRRLAAEYYKLTGRPLGATGELAEHAAVQKLGLKLAPVRAPGYDAIRDTPNGPERIQIKGLSVPAKPGQCMSKIRPGCDFVIFVRLDSRTFEPCEIWEAPMPAVEARLAVKGSKARGRRVLRVQEFQHLPGAKCIWRDDLHASPS
jgi:hypothetical protein